jgi:hypothetical protein
MCINSHSSARKSMHKVEYSFPLDLPAVIRLADPVLVFEARGICDER